MSRRKSRVKSFVPTLIRNLRDSTVKQTGGFTAETLKTDFCIIGFPNCGTSKLASYLSGLSSIHLATMNGAVDAPFFSKFGGVPKGSYEQGKKNGHCCASYIYGLTTLKEIFAANPSVVFVVCVRDVIDSVATWRVAQQREAAKASTGGGAAGSARPYLNGSIEEYYEQFAKAKLGYGRRLNSLTKHLPGANIMVVAYDALVGNPRAAVTKVARALGIELGDADLQQLPEKTPKSRKTEQPDSSSPIFDTLVDENRRLQAFLETLAGDRRVVRDGESLRIS